MTIPRSEQNTHYFSPQSIRVLAACAAAYIIATALTTWVFIGDAPDYAESVVAQFASGDCSFLEFGHLLWRTTGYLLLGIATGGGPASASRDTWVQALSLLTAASWTAGLFTVIATASWLRLVTQSTAATLAGVAFVIVNKSFLNFSQTGTSYVPALACLAIALWLGEVSARAETRRTLIAVLAGAALAGSMLLWATFVFIAPAVLLAPLILSSNWRERFPRVLIAGVVCAAVMLATYAWVGSVIGLHSLADYRAWISDSQHGISLGGPARAVIGLARFVVDLGGFGPLTKRYLLHDPFNPVNAVQLINLDLFKMFAVYLFAAICMALAWVAPNGRRGVAFFALAFGPMLAFGVMWQGGDLERFLPALPALAFVVALGYAASRRWRWARLTIIATIACVGLINIFAMSNIRVRAVRTGNMDRLAQFPDSVWRRDLFVVSHWHDPLMAAIRDNPFDQHVLSGLTIYPLVTTGMPDVPKWRESLAATVLGSWKAGRKVWVSQRLLSERPSVEWAWVEGDDDRLKWKDFPEFFKGLELQTPSGEGSKEFRLLVDAPMNHVVLESLAAGKQTPLSNATPVLKACRRVKLFSSTD